MEKAELEIMTQEQQDFYRNNLSNYIDRYGFKQGQKNCKRDAKKGVKNIESKKDTPLDLMKLALAELKNYNPTPDKRIALSVVDGAIEENLLTGLSKDIAETVVKYKKCSDKQLYWISKGLVEAGFYVKNGHIYNN